MGCVGRFVVMEAWETARNLRMIALSRGDDRACRFQSQRIIERGTWATSRLPQHKSRHHTCVGFSTIPDLFSSDSRRQPQAPSVDAEGADYGTCASREGMQGSSTQLPWLTVCLLQHHQASCSVLITVHHVTTTLWSAFSLPGLS